MWFAVLGLQKVDNDKFLKCAVCSLIESNSVCIYKTYLSVFPCKQTWLTKPDRSGNM